MLFSCDEFKERYYEEGLTHLETCQSFTPECFICQMSKVGFGIFSGKYSEPKKAEPLVIEGKEVPPEVEVPIIDIL